MTTVLDMIMRNDRAGIARIHAVMIEQIDQTWECPECESTEPKEDNGCSPRDSLFTALCTCCGHQFNPYDR